MARVIRQPCASVKDDARVDVRPVGRISAREEGERYAIDQHERIGCGAREPARPVGAIFERGAMPPRWRAYIQINASINASPVAQMKAP